MIVKIINARICFCQSLFTASQVMGEGEPKYGATFLLPKGNSQVEVLRKAMGTVAAEKWGAKAGGILADLTAANKVLLRDGKCKPEYDGFDGCMFFNASRKEFQGAPKIFNTDKTELTEADGVIYAGCYVNVSIELYAQDNKYGKRINGALRAIMFRADGEALGGSAPANEGEFDDISDVGAGEVNMETPPSGATDNMTDPPLY